MLPGTYRVTVEKGEANCAIGDSDEADRLIAKGLRVRRVTHPLGSPNTSVIEWRREPTTLERAEAEELLAGRVVQHAV